LFSYGYLEEPVPAGHPLWPIRKIADEGLTAMNQDFVELHAPIERLLIAPAAVASSLGDVVLQ
jgi:hypothetical protein